MGKTAKRTSATIAAMAVLAIVIVLSYYYWSNRAEPIDTTGKKLSEAQELINKDLVADYPATSREVTKLFANYMKVLYSHPKDEEIKPLALKVRQLYDKEFLDNNPEDTYLKNLITDLADWKKHNRKIALYLLINKEDEQETEIDGEKYSTKYISFTIQENIKFTEIWKVLLRQDSNNQWKILGWEYVPNEESEDEKD